jgi:hypothetical protein
MSSPPLLIKIIFVAQILVKLPNIKLHKNLPHGIQVVPCGQMDRHDKANIRSLKLHGRT